MSSPTLRLTFHGAAGQVTGSMHMLEAAGARIVLDAGLFQGRRRESDALNRNLPFDPRVLDAVVLSHSHIDHIGRVPLLVNHGFHGPIYATPATRDLCAVMLADSAEIQESDFRHLKKHEKAGPEAEPLYTLRDAVAAQELMMGVPYKRIQHLRKHLTIEYVDAGHILGSASIDVRITEGKQPHRLVFSGDIGRTGMPIIRNPDPPSGPIDTLIIESTYALKTHEPPSQAEDALADIIREFAGKGGKVLIPAFAVGRTQEMVYAIHQLFRENKIPEVPVYIDSPLATEVTTVFRMHPEIFDKSEEMVKAESPLFDHRLVRYTQSVEDSKRLNSLNGPAIIIASSGMVEAGRIVHHIKNHGTDSRNCILFVGFQAEGTQGRKIRDGERKVRLYGDEVELRAQVKSIDGYSAHAGRNELIAWIKALGGPIKRAFAVHGEPESLAEMANLLKQAGVSEVHVPSQGQSFDL